MPIDGRVVYCACCLLPPPTVIQVLKFKHDINDYRLILLQARNYHRCKTKLKSNKWFSLLKSFNSQYLFIFLIIVSLVMPYVFILILLIYFYTYLTSFWIHFRPVNRGLFAILQCYLHFFLLSQLKIIIKNVNSIIKL